MAIVAGVLALATAAAATGAAAAAGGYGIYKYFKRKVNQRGRHPPRDSEEQTDFGQELEVYKVTETRIPPPVAPKPVRGERRAGGAAVVTIEPRPSGKATEMTVRYEMGSTAAANVEDNVGPSGSGSCGAADVASSRHLSREALITRLCPNAVKVFPDPPPPGVGTTLGKPSSSRRGPQPQTCKSSGLAVVND